MSGNTPSTEKKWQQFYTAKELNTSFSGELLYDAIHKVDNPDRIAFRYFGMPFTYRKMYSEIDRVANAFLQNGIRKGDTVMLMVPTLPESIYCFYALNKIGAISNMVDVRLKPVQLLELAKKTKPRMLVVMSFYLKQLESVSSQLEFEKIILLRGCDSMPASVTFWYRLGEYFNGRKRITARHPYYTFWPEFVESGNNWTQEYTAQVSPDDIAAIYQTSGTTGFPKCVVHRNSSLDFSAALRINYLNDPQPGDTLLSILPIFAMYGFVFSIHMPLRFGMTVSIVPLFKPRNMLKLIRMHKPNYIFSVPSQLEEFAQDKAQDSDFSFIKNFFVAGDVLHNNIRTRVDQLLKTGNSQAVVCPDYGMTEVGGPISLQGIPIPLAQVCIFDGEQQKELGYGCQGEICAQTASQMVEYLNDASATKDLMRIHPDGRTWVHTGDMGYLTEDGHLCYIGRKKRMIVRFDGTKLFPVEIEAVIKKTPGVGECCVAPVTDQEHPHGYLPVAYVVNNSQEPGVKLMARIQKQCETNLPEHLLPSQIIIVDSIPHNSMGKIDYRQLSADHK